MFERFTESARRVVTRAQEEVRALRHGATGTEHILLALLDDAADEPARALTARGLTHDGVRAGIVAVVGDGEELAGGQVPFTPRAKQALELSLRSALELGDQYIGPGHMLLGVLRVPGALAGRVLDRLGVDPDDVAAEMRGVLSPRLTRPSGGSMAMVAEDRLRAVEPALTYSIGPEARLRRLLMAAAGRALTDGRAEFGLEDVLVTLAGDAEAARLLSDLWVDEATLRGAIESGRSSPPRPQQPQPTPQQPLARPAPGSASSRAPEPRADP